MSPRRARAARQGAALLTAATGAVVTAVLTAGPALAANDLGPREGEDPGQPLGIAMTLVLFVLVPAALLLGIAALVWLPGMVKADRYRPTRGWSAAPVWFAGPPDPVAAVETADVSTTTRGGASGNW